MSDERKNTKALSFRAELGMERVGRATWTVVPRGSGKRVGRRTSPISQSKGASHLVPCVIHELLGDPSHSFGMTEHSCEGFLDLLRQLWLLCGERFLARNLFLQFHQAFEQRFRSRRATGNVN